MGPREPVEMPTYSFLLGGEVKSGTGVGSVTELPGDLPPREEHDLKLPASRNTLDGTFCRLND